MKSRAIYSAGRCRANPSKRNTWLHRWPDEKPWSVHISFFSPFSGRIFVTCFAHDNNHITLKALSTAGKAVLTYVERQSDVLNLPLRIIVSNMYRTVSPTPKILRQQAARCAAFLQRMAALQLLGME